MGLYPKWRAAGLRIQILDGFFQILTFPDKFSSSDEGDISVHPHEVRKVPASVGSGVLAWHHALCGRRCNGWVSKLEQSIITQLQLHFMHRDRYPVALRPGCFFCLFSRWNLRHELQNTKRLRLWLPLWVPFPPPAVTVSRGKAKAVRSLQKKREISAGRVCTRQLICCEVWVPCSCWCDLLT